MYDIPLDDSQDDKTFILKNLYLKKIVKENHLHRICQLKFAEHHPQFLATVGSTQLSVYNIENQGNNLDVTLNFLNIDTPALVNIFQSCPTQPPLVFSPFLDPNATNNIVSSSEYIVRSNEHIESPLNSIELRNVSADFASHLNKLAHTQYLTMNSFNEERGYDEDVFVGVPKRSHDKFSATNMANNSVQNEALNRQDRQLNCFAWVSLHPPKHLLQHNVDLENSLLGQSTISQTKDTNNQDPTSNSVIADIDSSRINISDAWMAIAGNDTIVQLISLTHSKSLYALAGHYEPVICLASGYRSTLLASLSAHRIVIWDLPLIALHHYNASHSGGCGLDIAATFPAPTFSRIGAATGSNGEYLPPKMLPQHSKWASNVIDFAVAMPKCVAFCKFGLVAGTKRSLLFWKFSTDWKQRTSNRFSISQGFIDAPSNPTVIDTSWDQLECKFLLSDESIKYIASPRSPNTPNCILFCLSSHGRVFSLNFYQEEFTRQYDIRLVNNFIPSVVCPIRCFDVSKCGDFVCCGSDRGDVHIFNAHTAEEISILSHKRSKSPLTACAFSHQCKTVLFCSESILWIWNFIHPDTLKQEQDEQARAEAEGKDVSESESGEYSDVEDNMETNSSVKL